MTRRFPPLNGLRAFEAAARRGSFKHAAEELHVTPAAISQQVRALEDFLGVRLFERLTREVRLTEAGSRALPRLTEGFDRIAEAVMAMSVEPATAPLTVSVAPTFATKWLVPRLSRFRTAHPDIDLVIDAAEAPATFSGDGVDVAIRYGPGSYQGLRADCLMPEVTFPVASPRLLERGPPIRTPADLAGHPLLHVRWRMQRDAVASWRMWLRAAGADHVDGERGMRFSSETLALQAAIEAQGVALATEALVLEDLRTGRLVRPFPEHMRQETAFCFWLVTPRPRANEPRIAAFREWILREVAAERETANGHGVRDLPLLVAGNDP